MENKISRTEQEYAAIENGTSYSKRVLRYMFSQEGYATTAMIAKGTGLEVVRVQSTINYMKKHNQAVLVSRPHDNRRNEYLLVSVNTTPGTFCANDKIVYVNHAGVPFEGVTRICRHLKIEPHILRYQLDDLGKSIDEAVLYLQTTGEIAKKEPSPMRFVKRAMNCPTPCWMGSLTPQARV